MKRISILLVIFVMVLTLLVGIASANGQGHAHGHNNPHNPHYQGGNPGGGGGSGNNPNSGPGNNNGNGNPNPPGPPGQSSGPVYNGDIYNGDVTNNDFLYEYFVNQSYDFSNIETTIYDQRQYISVDNTEVLEAIAGLSADNLHQMVNDEANATLGIKYGEISASTIYIPESINIDPDTVFSKNPNIYLNPTKKTVQLRKGEFCSVKIAVVSDVNSILKVKCANPNVKVITKTLVVLANTPAVAEVQLYFKSKATQWEYATIIFEDSLSKKELSQKSIIVFENKEALDWKARFATDTNMTSGGISVSQNKTTWGWGLFTGVKTDRHGNNTVYMVGEIDL